MLLQQAQSLESQSVLKVASYFHNNGRAAMERLKFIKQL